MTALLPLPACGPLFEVVWDKTREYAIAEHGIGARRTLLRFPTREEADAALAQARWDRDEDVYEVVTRVRRLRRRK
jgi:hypothetical protein